MESSNMQYIEEINYRNMIMERRRKGEKLTREERQWIDTHRLINRELGYPYLNTDMIQLQPNERYHIHVQVESRSYEGRMIPIITVPAQKGSIVSNLELTDYEGNIKTGQEVKMLGLLTDVAEFDYRSELGLLGVSYECDYFDDRLRVMQRIDSGLGYPNFAMLREDLSENKVLYRCKTPVKDNYEGLVFSITWRRWP